MRAFLDVVNQASGIVLSGALNTLWQAALLAAIVWAALRLARGINAATRHLIWWGVLAVVVLLPVAPRLMPERHARMESAAEAVSTAAVEAGPAPPVQPATFAVQHVEPAAHAVRPGQWPLAVAGLWAAVLLLLSARLLWSYLYLSGLKRRAAPAPRELRRNFEVWMLACGVHRPMRLLISDEVSSPMAVGFRDPAVILPETLLTEFGGSDLDHVLLHEMAHIARRDDWSNLAARCGWAVLALHPAAAWCLRQIEREREIACDDWVVAATGDARPYAASLARLFEICFIRRRQVLATGMAEHASQLGERIEMLLRRSREFSPDVNLLRAGGCFIVLALLAAAGASAPRWIAFAQDRPAAPAPPAPAATEGPRAEPAPPALRVRGYRKVVAQAHPVPAPAPAARPADIPAPPSSQPKTFLAALVAAGYGDLSVDDIIALKSSGVTAEFLTGVAQSKWGKPSVRDLIDLRNNGVTAQYLRAMRDAGGTGIAIRETIDLRRNGVTPEYVRDVQASGQGPYTVQQIVEFRNRGVRPELLRALKEAGYRGVEPREIIELQNCGVGAASLREARQYGPNLTIKQIVRLKQAGVI